MENENIIYNDGKVIIFPISADELEVLAHSKQQFSEAINVRYICEDFEEPQALLKRANYLRENPQNWVNNAYWVILSIDERQIVGYLVLTEDKSTDTIKVEKYLSKGYDKLILTRAGIMLKMYENDYGVVISNNDLGINKE